MFYTVLKRTENCTGGGNVRAICPGENVRIPQLHRRRVSSISRRLEGRPHASNSVHCWPDKLSQYSWLGYLFLVVCVSCDGLLRCRDVVCNNFNSQHEVFASIYRPADSGYSRPAPGRATN